MTNSAVRKVVVGAVTLGSLVAVNGARGALVSNLGFEGLTGSDPQHFSGGMLISGHMSASANPSNDANVYVTSDPAPSWDVDTAAGGTMRPTAAYMPAGPLEGEYVGYSTGSILSQELSVDIEPSTVYTLSVGVGRPDLVGVGFKYHVWFSSGGLVLAEDWNTQQVGLGEWGTSTVTWVSPAEVAAGSKLTINLASDGGVVLFDSVETAAAPVVPEPVAGAMVVAPVLMAMGRRRRRE